MYELVAIFVNLCSATTYSVLPLCTVFWAISIYLFLTLFYQGLKGPCQALPHFLSSWGSGRTFCPNLKSSLIFRKYLRHYIILLKF